MAQLILVDTAGHELGRRTIEDAERLFFYKAWDTHDLISFEGKRYRIHTCAWKIPEHDLVLRVSFDSWDHYED